MNSLSLKAAWKEGQLTVGTWVMELNSPGVARLIASTGVDFVVYDQEHSGFGMDTIRGLIAQTRPLGLAALVRPTGSEYHLIAPLLDAGASGVIVPNIKTVAEAKRVADACRYYPDGERGAAFAVAHDDFLSGDVPTKMKAANDAMVCGLLIESVEGVANLEDIVAIKGVDLIWLGFLDLTLSMGIPGQYQNPKFEEAVNRILTICSAHNKPVGILSNDVEQSRKYVQQGFKAISYGGELWLLQRALTEGVKAIRSG